MALDLKKMQQDREDELRSAFYVLGLVKSARESLTAGFNQMGLTKEQNEKLYEIEMQLADLALSIKNSNS